MRTWGGAISSEESAEDAGAASQESMDAVVAYIDRMNTAFLDVYEPLVSTEMPDDWDAADYAAYFSGGGASLEALQADMSELQAEVDALEGVDRKMREAEQEYYSVYSNFLSHYADMMNFVGDFFALEGDTLLRRPDINDYQYIDDYYTDLNAWTQAARDGYDALDTCPTSMRSVWAGFRENIDLNDTIVEKMYQAANYGDYLRYFSAGYLSDRYDTVDSVQTDKLTTCMTEEENFLLEIATEVSDNLYDEICSYAEMDEEERESYTFRNIQSGRLSLQYEPASTIYPSLYNTYDAFLIIKGGCLSGSRNIIVEMEIPGFTQKYRQGFTLNGQEYTQIYVKPPALTGNLNLASAKNAQINVTISDQNGGVIDVQTFPVTIKSKYDFEWFTEDYGVVTKDNILCFLTPEAVAVSKLKRQAITELSDMTGGGMEAFVGYQGNAWGNNYVGTYLQSAGIMRAMYDMGVRYNMDPFSLSGSNQHILLPEDVLDQGSGLCIETALTVASALQSAGMHAFLLLPTGHAQVAVEIWDGSGRDASGTGEYFLIETTALSSRSNNNSLFVADANSILNNGVSGTDFQGPIEYLDSEEWLDYIYQNDVYVIDCGDSGMLGLTMFAN